MPVVLLSLLLLVLPGTSRADEYMPWTEVTFATSAPAPYGRMRVTARVDGQGRLADLAVVTETGKTLSAPAAAWADIDHVQLGLVRTTFKAGFDSPWLFIHIPHGTPIPVRGGSEWAALVIAFRGERAVYRALRVPKPDGGFEWTPTDLPR
ncbi:MAG: hypothetical protein IT385_05310 [Deltaproteobacteria bacterium]|nr:hypothetical protein [Deltaproteobacteria bacterium]